jgi:isopenicillin N synthase-like dioxygenase
MTIPVLDASALSNGGEQQVAEFRTKLFEGLGTYGFVKLINHMVPMPLVKETFDQVSALGTPFRNHKKSKS